MRLEVDIPVTLALLKRPEVICILAIVLILSGRKYFRDFQRGFGRGVFEFRDAIDDEAREAGRAAGANFGKPALDALTQDNEAVEFRAFSALRPNKTKSTAASAIQNSKRNRGRDITR